MFLAARFIRSIHPDPSGIPWAGSGGEVLGFFLLLPLSAYTPKLGPSSFFGPRREYMWWGFILFASFFPPNEWCLGQC